MQTSKQSFKSVIYQMIPNERGIFLKKVKPLITTSTPNICFYTSKINPIPLIEYLNP